MYVESPCSKDVDFYALADTHFDLWSKFMLQCPILDPYNAFPYLHSSIWLVIAGLVDIDDHQEQKGDNSLAIGVGIGVSTTVALAVIIVAAFILLRKRITKQKYATETLRSSNFAGI